MRLRRLAPFVALALCGTMLGSLPVAAATVPAASQDEVPSSLPRTARPTHYAIAITTDAKAMTFKGTFAIDVEVLTQTQSIVVNSDLLTIGAVRLIPAQGSAVPLSVTLDSAAQTATFGAQKAIEPGLYRLEGTYNGPIDTQAAGLFGLDYKDPSGKDTRALFTQFEPPYARRLAPMFDEPIYKATFDLTVTVPADLMAVSNMPAVIETPAGPGLKTVRFQTSPKMSSYLLFFGLGEFERLAKPAGNGVEVGIVSPRGSGEQARFALDELAKLIPYYSDYFGQPYPLPKLDNIAGPGQSQFFGAMENWGAIFTFQRGLLDDPANTTPASRGYIATTQAHEVAHQWFGDLVTMAWWDDIWLNEGFASWMETKATDHFHPDWFQLLTRVGGREEAMGLDAFSTTHPIVQKIRTVEETNQAFDEITYQKGEAVISMLEAYAGEDTWRTGLQAYMAEHKFANSRTEDLWRAVEKAGATGLTDIAHDFTNQPGIPLVRVGTAKCAAGKTTLTLTQDEFTRDRMGQPSAMRWRVPLLVANGTGAPVRSIMADAKATVTVDGCGPVVINAGQLGYYRSLYTPAMLTTLGKALPTLKPIDQLGLVADQMELSQAGYQPMAGALALLGAVPGDANPLVAAEAIGRYADLYDRFGDDKAGKAKVATRAIAQWKQRLDTLGFEPRKDESLADANLRSSLVAVLGKMGEPGVVGEARRRFALLDANPRAMDGPLKTTWLRVVARKATAAEWDKLEKRAEAAISPVERADAFTLLGAAEDPALSQKALDLSLTPTPGATTSAAMITQVSYHNSAQAFDFFLANRDKVYGLVDASGRSRFLQRITGEADTQAMADRLTAYAKTLDDDMRAPVERALSAIRDRVAANPRIRTETLAWLARK